MVLTKNLINSKMFGVVETSILFEGEKYSYEEYDQLVIANYERFEIIEKTVKKFLAIHSPEILNYIESIDYEFRPHQWVLDINYIRGYLINKTDSTKFNVMDLFPSSGKTSSTVVLLVPLLHVYNHLMITSASKPAIAVFEKGFTEFLSNSKNKTAVRKLLGKNITIFSETPERFDFITNSKLISSYEIKSIPNANDKTHNLIFSNIHKLVNTNKEIPLKQSKSYILRENIANTLDSLEFYYIIDEGNRIFQNHGYAKEQQFSNGNSIMNDKKFMLWLMNRKRKGTSILSGTPSPIQLNEEYTPAGTPIELVGKSMFVPHEGIYASDIVDFMKNIKIVHYEDDNVLSYNFAKNTYDDYKNISVVKANGLVLVPSQKKNDRDISDRTITMIKDNLKKEFGSDYDESMCLTYFSNDPDAPSDSEVESRLNDPNDSLRFVFIKLKFGDAVNIPGIRNTLWLRDIKNAEDIYMTQNQGVTRGVRIIPWKGYKSFQDVINFGNSHDYEFFSQLNSLTLYVRTSSLTKFENDLISKYPNESLIKSRDAYAHNIFKKRDDVRVIKQKTDGLTPLKADINVDFSNISIMEDRTLSGFENRLKSYPSRVTAQTLCDLTNIKIYNIDNNDHGINGKVVETATLGTEPNPHRISDGIGFDVKAELMKNGKLIDHMKIGHIKVQELLDPKFAKDFMMKSIIGQKSHTIALVEVDGTVDRNNWTENVIETDHYYHIPILKYMKEEFELCINEAKNMLVNMMINPNAANKLSVSGDRSTFMRSHSLFDDRESLLVLESFDKNNDNFFDTSITLYVNMKFLNPILHTFKKSF